jgi:hypothetical protein
MKLTTYVHTVSSLRAHGVLSLLTHTCSSHDARDNVLLCGLTPSLADSSSILWAGHIEITGKNASVFIFLHNLQRIFFGRHESHLKTCFKVTEWTYFFSKFSSTKINLQFFLDHVQ